MDGVYRMIPPGPRRWLSGGINKEQIPRPKRKRIPANLSLLFQKKVWKGEYIEGSDLSALNLSQKRFEDVIFVDCKISAFTFKDCDSLEGITLENCTIKNQDLTSVRFRGAHLTRVRFEDCLITGETIRDLGRVNDCNLGVPIENISFFRREERGSISLFDFAEKFEEVHPQ